MNFEVENLINWLRFEILDLILELDLGDLEVEFNFGGFFLEELFQLLKFNFGWDLSFWI